MHLAQINFVIPPNCDILITPSMILPTSIIQRKTFNSIKTVSHWTSKTNHLACRQTREHILFWNLPNNLRCYPHIDQSGSEDSLSELWSFSQQWAFTFIHNSQLTHTHNHHYLAQYGSNSSNWKSSASLIQGWKKFSVLQYHTEIEFSISQMDTSKRSHQSVWANFWNKSKIKK